MENASKALIIAGAILLAISIIGIGMYVYQQAAGAMQGIGMDKEQIATYNGEFETYEGNKNGATVRNLCDLIRNHNLANSDDASKQITLVSGKVDAEGDISGHTAGSTTTEINTIKQKIKTGQSYTVSLKYDKKTGLIFEIGIEGVK